nr:MAG TPA: hypothetical protein [Bacteriophage sp.]
MYYRKQKTLCKIEFADLKCIGMVWSDRVRLSVQLFTAN